MRYAPCVYPKVSRGWTNRRIKAAERAVQRDADSVALFPELRRYSSVEDRMKEIDSREEKLFFHMREYRNICWREIRRWLDGKPKKLRLEIRNRWNENNFPADPSYFWAFAQMEGYVTLQEIRARIHQREEQSAKNES